MGGLVSVPGSGGPPAKPEDMEEAKKGVQDLIQQNKIVIFSKAACPYCVDAKNCFDKLKVQYTLIELNGHPQGSLIQDILLQMTGARTVPRVFINGKCIGGGTETVSLFKSGQLQKMIEKNWLEQYEQEQDYQQGQDLQVQPKRAAHL